jgi:hypothetical protein
VNKRLGLGLGLGGGCGFSVYIFAPICLPFFFANDLGSVTAAWWMAAGEVSANGLRLRASQPGASQNSQGERAFGNIFVFNRP